MKNKLKNICISVLELSEKKSDKVRKQTITINKGDFLSFVLKSPNSDKIQGFPYDKFDVHIEVEDDYKNVYDSSKDENIVSNDNCKHIQRKELSHDDGLQYYKKLCKTFDKTTVSEILTRATSFNFFKGLRSGKSFRVCFKNKESGGESFVEVKIRRRWLLIVPVSLLAISAIIASNFIGNPKSNKPVGNIVMEKETTKEVNNNVIVFPDNLTHISITKSNPYFKFFNNSCNKVYFHYYIYDYNSNTMINIGQIAPVDDKALKVDLSKYFEPGKYKVRVDIKTFKDKEETIEKHPMSYSCILRYKNE